MRRWFTIAALLVATVFAQGQTTALRTILSGDNPILFSYSAGDSLAAATFTRASTATYRDVAGILQTASSGVARDNHYALDPVSGLYKRSLLLEGQRTNLALRSQEFDHATWNKLGATATANAVSGPDGALSMDTLVEDGGNSRHIFYSSATLAASAYTYSIYAKKAGRDYIYLRVDDTGVAGAGHGASFNLNTGAVTQTVNATASIEATPIAGIYRCSMVFTQVTTGANNIHVGSGGTDGVLDAGGEKTFVGNSADAVHCFGAQPELGAFPSSYIPTTTATVTRAADSLSFPFPYPPQELTVFARFIEGGTSLVNGGFVLNLGGSSAARLAIYNATPNYRALWQLAGTPVLSTQAAAPAIGQRVELRSILGAAGTATIGQSIDAAAETVEATSSPLALPGAFNAPTIDVNSDQGGSVGFAAFRDIIIAKREREMAFFRNRINN